jgi:hypothetical protein
MDETVVGSLFFNAHTYVPQSVAGLNQGMRALCVFTHYL